MTFLRRLVPCAAVLALLASARAADAQQRQLVGSRVRITAPSVMQGKFTGQVTAFDTAQLVVHDSVAGVDQAFPLHSILFMELSRGNTRAGSAGQRAGLMAFVLGGVGAIAGALGHPFKTIGTSVAIGGAGGALVGAGIGAAWGAGTPRERWEWSVRPFGYAPRTDATVAPPPPPLPQP